MKLYVKPVGRIRQPDRHMKVMPEAGTTIDTNNPYYGRLLASGDIVEAEPPKGKSSQQDTE